MFTNRMDNPNFRKDGEKGTELKSVVATTNGNSSLAADNLVSCRPEVCRSARQRYTPPDLGGSPWHRKKTIFLVGIIVILIIWIIIFTILGKMELL